jgi:glycerol uptake facilitator-like aquaporin
MWGILMELMQALVTMLGWAQRGFDWQDMLANAVGALLAAFLTGCVMILWTWGFCRKKRE